MHSQLFTLGLRGYIAFVKDMAIPIDKARVIEVWKKSCINHQPHNYDDFVNSLRRLSIGSLKHRSEVNSKKASQIAVAIDCLGLWHASLA